MLTNKSLLNSTPFVMVVVSLSMTVVTAFNAYILSETVVPNVEALAPVTAQKAQVAIALQLPGTSEGNAAAQIAQYQVNELHMVHSSWLAQVRSQASSARTQLVAWLVVLALSGIAVFEKYRQGKQCGPTS